MSTAASEASWRRGTLTNPLRSVVSLHQSKWRRLQIARSLAFRLALAESLSPCEIDPSPPRILGLLFDLPLRWTYGTSPLSSAPEVLRGRAGGLEAARHIWNHNRLVPTIVISAEEGFVLHPGIESSISRDLLGLANVLRIDEEAAWCLTQEYGKDWSCYAGAIRLYWPAVERFSSPFDHPLWTPQRLLEGAVDSNAAARRLRTELRRLAGR